MVDRMPKLPEFSIPVLVTSKLIGSALSISQIVIGAMNLENCPIQRYIPIYLVVSGVFSLSLTLLSCLPCTQNTEEGFVTAVRCYSRWSDIVSSFLFCWFIAGNVWIYSIYQPNYNPDTEPYCDKTVYLFAFWITTLSYLLWGGVLIVVCCAVMSSCVAGSVS